MPHNLISFCRFHLKRLVRIQARAFFALTGATLLLVLASVSLIDQWHLAETAQQELRSMNQTTRTSTNIVKAVNAQVALPDFTSAQLVTTLNRVAEETKLPLDEIIFTLDDSGNQPYLRYRATLSVSGSYPTIRRFLDQVRANFSTVSLDTISCTREDIGTIDLTCDLAVSVFFRKNARG